MGGRRSVSMRDVAGLAGVSVGTVSNVLNVPEIVAEETKTKVHEAIARLGWVRNESARQLRAGRSRAIGMVVMSVSNPFFTDVMEGVESYAIDHGYVLHFANSAEDLAREETQLALFEQLRVGGVLLAPVGEVSGARRDRFQRAGIPLVLVDRAGDATDMCSVSVDDVAGGRIAANHLIERGHTRLGFVGGPDNVPQVRDRRQGLQGAVAASPQPVAVDLIDSHRLDVGSGLAAAEELATRPPQERPTAVFAANDLLAIGLLQGFTTHGIRIPDDVAIVGYDDIQFAAAAAVPLSSVRQPRHQLGSAGAELLLREIRDTEQGATHQHEQVRFTPELVVRRSSMT